MRNLITEYAAGQLIAGAIVLVMALLYDDWQNRKNRRRPPWP